MLSSNNQYCVHVHTCTCRSTQGTLCKIEDTYDKQNVMLIDELTVSLAKLCSSLMINIISKRDKIVGMKSIF